MSLMREIVFDTETTGFDPEEGDRMVEIGCIEMVGRVETGRTFHCYFNPQRPMPQSAYEVHGLDEKFLSDKPLFQDKADALLEFLGDADLVAHNARFDFKFLNAELRGINRPTITETRMVDTLAIAKAKFPGSKLSLDALCSRFGVDRSHRVKHGALLDAELLTQVYIELTGGRQIGMELAAEQVSETIDEHSAGAVSASTAPSRREVRTARQFLASEDEIATHSAFIRKIKNPLWAKLDPRRYGAAD